MTRTRSLTLRLVLALILAALSLIFIMSRAAPKPTANVMTSLFANDTCAPPCWFGLVPGESTQEEVAAFVAAGLPEGMRWGRQPYIEDAGVVVSTEYRGYWQGIDWDLQTRTELTVREGLLDEMQLEVNPEPTLGEMLDKFGQPDRWRISYIPYTPDIADLEAIYAEQRIRVYIKPPEDCRFQNTLERFTVGYLTYLSPSAAEEATWLAGSSHAEQAYPRLWMYGINQYDIPVETWESWLDSDLSCFEAWQQVAPTLPYVGE